MSTSTGTGKGRRPRRLVVLGIVLLAVLGLATTCVVVAQTGNFDDDRIGDDEGSAPPRASRSDNGSTPEDSGPAATPWQKASWRSATKKNQIVAVTLPPKPAAAQARKDPLRVSLVLLATLDSTNPDEWQPGVNPLRGYMSSALDKQYTPPKNGDPTGEDPGDGAVKLPDGAQARYEMYCYVVSHEEKKVVSRCGYHVRTKKGRKVLRDDDGADQRVTAARARDGWRVTRMAPVAGPGGD